MRRAVVVVCLLVAAAPVATTAAEPAAFRCRPTPNDAFGPFGRGIPPLRAKIGTGHVLTGVVVSALDCGPLARAQVQYWQSNRQGRYTRAGSGTVLTDARGRFRFEGPFPPSYEGRPPHIHLRVIGKDHETLLARFVPARGAKRSTIRLVLVPLRL